MSHCRPAGNFFVISFPFIPNFEVSSFEIWRLIFSLQVKDFDKFHFKPGELVKSITEILLNLGTEKDFCKALVSLFLPAHYFSSQNLHLCYHVLASIVVEDHHPPLFSTREGAKILFSKYLASE